MAQEKEEKIIDLRGVDNVQVQVDADGHKLWVNIDGICRLRVYAAQRIDIDDPRKPRERDFHKDHPEYAPKKENEG